MRPRFAGQQSLLALRREIVLPCHLVISLFIPWDFVLILLFFATVLPWRGDVRMKRLLAKPDLDSRDRLSLYRSTILFQWTLVALVVWRCAARGVELQELGLAAGDPWRIVWTSIALTGLLCVNQILGLRKVAKLPEGQRGSLFRITEKIMPRGRSEMLVYVALVCTAGVSEEFLYRGFVFMAFVRMIVNYGPPNGSAAILSSAWFSLAHLYQGRRGLLTTFVVAMIFVALRIWTGSLVPAIAAHIGLDLAVGIFASKSLTRLPQESH